MAKFQFDQLSPEERAECGRKGGIKSGETRRKKRAMKEAIEVVLSMPMKKGRKYDVEDIKSFSDIKGKNISVNDAIIIAAVQKALRGDVRALEWLRDTSGQKQSENVSMNVELPVFFSGEDEL